MADVRAILFDIFGTVVDWRGSLIAALSGWGRAKGCEADWAGLADAWRGAHQPAFAKVRAEGWRDLDRINRDALAALAPRFGLTLNDAELDRINRFWRALNPWPDAVPALRRLDSRYTIGPLSNGNVGLLEDMARFAELPWTVILGADLFGHYKPDRQVYLGACRLLKLEPDEIMLAASHNYDLAAARQLGLKTAFFPRTTEHGPGQSGNLAAESDWDVIAADMLDLAARMGT